MIDHTEGWDHMLCWEYKHDYRLLDGRTLTGRYSVYARCQDEAKVVSQVHFRIALTAAGVDWQ